MLEENLSKSETYHIQFEELEMSTYLVDKEYKTMSNILLCVKSGTLGMKYFNEWNYSDNPCVMCKWTEETIDHFMSFCAYGKTSK